MTKAALQAAQELGYLVCDLRQKCVTELRGNVCGFLVLVNILSYLLLFLVNVTVSHFMRFHRFFVFIIISGIVFIKVALRYISLE